MVLYGYLLYCFVQFRSRLCTYDGAWILWIISDDFRFRTFFLKCSSIQPSSSIYKSVQHLFCCIIIFRLLTYTCFWKQSNRKGDSGRIDFVFLSPAKCLLLSTTNNSAQQTLAVANGNQLFFISSASLLVFMPSSVKSRTNKDNENVLIAQHWVCHE